MAANDVIVLTNIIKQRNAQVYPSMSEADFFEIFSFEQVLKNYDLSDDELLAGRVGSSGDGGIDGFFCFINKDTLDEDIVTEEVRRYPEIELFLIQSKRSPSYSETAIEHVIATVTDIFDLTKDTKALRSFFNSELIYKADLFRETYIALSSKHPRLTIRFVYASLGDIVDPKVKNKAQLLRDTLTGQFSGADVETEFIGARRLLDLVRAVKSYSLQLRFLENYISRREDSYIFLASLSDYFSLVVDEAGDLRRYIFESNVRDYQGNNDVNSGITETLRSGDPEVDFWWLNNGITILTSKASVASKLITLDDVQIVNGLQTTTEIYNYLKDTSSKDDPRALLVRIIVTDDPERRDHIIKATNFQTAIPPSSLRATDRIQRSIEDFFLQHNWFYDRRKNYYKNLGRPVERIIPIPYLAQALMAIVLQKPDSARARPTTLIKADHDYKRVFDDTLSLEIYLYCAKAMKEIDRFIRLGSSDVDLQDGRNLRFHLAMLYTMVLLGKRTYRGSDVMQCLSRDVGFEVLARCQKQILDLRLAFDSGQVEARGWSLDRTAKSPDFVTYIVDNADVGWLHISNAQVSS